MPAGPVGQPESVNAFPIDDVVLFKHYFDGEVVFDRLKVYYSNEQYRFEVPADEFDSVRRFLESHGYELAVVDSLREYYVVVKQYSHHPENIFKDAVKIGSTEGYNCFLLKDRQAVETAVSQGATRLVETSLSVSLPQKLLDDYAEGYP